MLSLLSLLVSSEFIKNRILFNVVSRAETKTVFDLCCQQSPPVTGTFKEEGTVEGAHVCVSLSGSTVIF